MTALWYIYTCTLNPVESNHKDGHTGRAVKVMKNKIVC